MLSDLTTIKTKQLRYKNKKHNIKKPYCIPCHFMNKYIALFSKVNSRKKMHCHSVNTVF